MILDVPYKVHNFVQVLFNSESRYMFGLIENL